MRCAQLAALRTQQGLQIACRQIAQSQQSIDKSMQCWVNSPWLVQVPLSCDLGQIVKQLAHLGCYDGILDLPLRRAAAVDPENAARLPGEAGRAAREVDSACA